MTKHKSHNTAGSHIPIDDISMRDVEHDLQEIRNYGGSHVQRSKSESTLGKFDLPMNKPSGFFQQNTHHSRGQKSNGVFSYNLDLSELRSRSGNTRNNFQEQPFGAEYGKSNAGIYSIKNEDKVAFPETNVRKLPKSDMEHVKNDNREQYPEMDFAKARYNIEDIKEELMRDSMSGNAGADFQLLSGAGKDGGKGYINQQTRENWEPRQLEDLAATQNNPAEFYYARNNFRIPFGRRRKDPRYYQNIHPNQGLVGRGGAWRGNAGGTVDKDMLEKMMGYLNDESPPRYRMSAGKARRRWDLPTSGKGSLHIRSGNRINEPDNTKTEVENSKKLAEALAFWKNPEDKETGIADFDNDISEDLDLASLEETDPESDKNFADAMSVPGNAGDSPEMSNGLNRVDASIYGIGQGEPEIHRSKSRKKTKKKTKPGKTEQGLARWQLTRKAKNKKESKVANMVGYTTFEVNETYPDLPPEMMDTGNDVTGHAKVNSTTIVDQGVDEVDLPKTDTSTWQKIIHGRRDILLGGSVVAGVGILLIFFTMIYFIISKRKRLTAQNKNNSKLYKRLGTTDERATLRQKRRGQSLFPLSSDEDEDSSDEDTVFNYMQRDNY